MSLSISFVKHTHIYVYVYVLLKQREIENRSLKAFKKKNSEVYFSLKFGGDLGSLSEKRDLQKTIIKL